MASTGGIAGLGYGLGEQVEPAQRESLVAAVHGVAVGVGVGEQVGVCASELILRAKSTKREQHKAISRGSVILLRG